jgi:hypothetical protein
MKRLAAVMFIATLALCGAARADHPQEISASAGFFHSSLSPYGEWVDAEIGYAWRPNHVGRHWRPYLHGRWAWTDYGWYWVSNEPFGWATFHYGRWTYDDYYGWIWIPDRIWGPAWVEWRYDDDYIGWAPLTPYARFAVNVGIVWSNHWVSPVHYWNFLPSRRFTTARVSDYIEPAERTRRIFGHTRGVVNIRSERDRVINDGIDARFVERRANIRIPRVDVVDRSDPSADRFVKDSRRSRIETYRPRIDDRTRPDLRPAPATRSGRDDRPGAAERGYDRQQRNEGTSGDVRAEGRGRSEERREVMRPRGDQERRLQEQRESRVRERQVQQQEQRQSRQRQESTNEQGRKPERPSVNRGSQQGDRERSPGRTPPQQGEQRARGRRPA